MPEPRPPITSDTLASLVRAAGLDLGPERLDALLAPTRAIYAAVDGLDALDLDDVEPAAVLRLGAE